MVLSPGPERRGLVLQEGNRGPLAPQDVLVDLGPSGHPGLQVRLKKLLFHHRLL